MMLLAEKKPLEVLIHWLPKRPAVWFPAAMRKEDTRLDKEDSALSMDPLPVVSLDSPLLLPQNHAETPQGRFEAETFLHIPEN